jgi:cobalt-zinc-cadmium efflux system protein
MGMMKTNSRPVVIPVATEHTHEHGHEHAHSYGPEAEGRLRLALGLTLLILAVEVVGGFLANSLALLADAGHMLTDVFALGLSWFALVQSRRPADARRTFGYHRVSILAALLNAATLLPLSAFIIWEALGRFATPPEVEGGLMFWVALVGLVANVLIGLGLHGAAGENLNIQSATIHVLGDAVASAGVLVAAVVITLTGWTPIDPLLSIGIALLVAFSGWRVVRETVRILLESVPKDVDAAAVVARMRQVPGVLDVHDLHIWQIGSGIYALSCHVQIADQMVSQCSNILSQLNHLLEHEFRIGHSTIQPECAGCDPNSLYCSLTPIGTPGAHGGPHPE